MPATERSSGVTNRSSSHPKQSPRPPSRKIAPAVRRSPEAFVPPPRSHQRFFLDLEFRQLVERVKLRSPIEVVVGERVSELKRKGALHWARCPFHDERTASFAVDPRKGTWRCYGACGDGGDALSFVQRFDGLGFVDALKLLAQAAGEEIPEAILGQRQSPEKAQRHEARHDVLTRAGALYRRLLASEEGAEARAYGQSRGLSEETQSTFGIGWAPYRGNPVLDAARRSGVETELLVETGLCKRGDDGRVYDFFHGRWIVPITDRLGRTMGFGGRILPRDEGGGGPQAKYVNTPETPLFHKGRLIYGLDLALPAIRKGRRIVLVEGYTDVMAAHQAGVLDTAAILGTSTTDDHAHLVRRSGAQRAVLVFDGDAAGRKATARALQGLLPLELEIRICTLPAGQDPCDQLVSEGSESFERSLDEASDWFAWLLRGLEGLSGAELASGVDGAFQLLARLTRPVERSSRLGEMARHLGLPEGDLRTQWSAFERGRRRPRLEAVPAQHVEPEGRATEPQGEYPGAAELQAFELLVGALLLDNSLIPLYADLYGRLQPALDTEADASGRGADLAAIFKVVLELYEESDGEPFGAGSVMTALADDPVRDRVVALEERARTAESPELLAGDQAAWLARRSEERELAELRGRLEENVRTFEGGTGANGVLEALHAKMRRARVPG